LLRNTDRNYNFSFWIFLISFFNFFCSFFIERIPSTCNITIITKLFYKKYILSCHSHMILALPTCIKLDELEVFLFFVFLFFVGDDFFLFFVALDITVFYWIKFFQLKHFSKMFSGRQITRQIFSLRSIVNNTQVRTKVKHAFPKGKSLTEYIPISRVPTKPTGTKIYMSKFTVCIIFMFLNELKGNTR